MWTQTALLMEAMHWEKQEKKGGGMGGAAGAGAGVSKGWREKEKGSERARKKEKGCRRKYM